MLCFLWADPKVLCLCSKSGIRIVCTGASYLNNSENIFSYVSGKMCSSAAWKQQLKYIRHCPHCPFPDYVSDGQCTESRNRSASSFSSFSLEIWQGQAVLLSICVILCFTTRRDIYIQITSLCPPEKVTFLFSFCSPKYFVCGLLSLLNNIHTAFWSSCFVLLNCLLIFICAPHGVSLNVLSLAWWEKGSFSVPLLHFSWWIAEVLFFFGCPATLRVISGNELNSSPW